MKIGIISDIHGNYEALSVVANYLERFCDCIICLGDIVGYGPDPEKCVTLIKEAGYKTIAGNHEYAVLDRIDCEYFHRLAKESVKYTKAQLSKKNMQYLDELPLSFAIDDISFTHASFDEELPWVYLCDSNIKKQLECLKTKIGFVGHTHIPLYYQKKNGEIFTNKEYFINPELTIEDDFKYIINVGSVGQPRDLQTKASFGVYDTHTKEFLLDRMDYNLDRTIKKIKYSSLPKELADRLTEGK